MEIYLDNAASTRPFKEVADYYADSMFNLYANPSALHSFGNKALQITEYAKEQLLITAGLSNRRVVFTSGATESANLAIKGIIEKLGNTDKCEIITSTFEHPCVSRVFEYYKKKNIIVKYVPVNPLGKFDVDFLLNCINENTRIVSLIWVNNEIGSLNDVNNIIKLIKEKNERVLTHVDAVQGFGKIFCGMTDADMITVSAHKFHGPKGIGALICKPGVVLLPQMLGGGHQDNLRSGTINAPGIGAMGKACEIINSGVYENHLAETQKYLYSKLSEEFGEEAINSKIYASDFAPHIISISFPGLKAEVIVHMLEQSGIYVSTSSACSSNKTEHNSVLHSLGFDKKRIEGTLRISISEFTDSMQIDELIDNLKACVKRLRGLGI